ncbi:MAG: DUF423 domain-containing protein [Planctomycetota bacterium]
MATSSCHLSFRATLLIAGLLGLTAVLAGTFGAHGLEGRVEEDLLPTFEVGVRYHAYHALAVLACCGFIERLGKGGKWAVTFFVIGTIIFAGTLYLLTLTGQRWLGAITPIGGVCLLAGWASLAITALRAKTPIAST